MLYPTDPVAEAAARARNARIKLLDKVKMVEIHQEQRKNPEIVEGLWRTQKQVSKE